MQITMSDIRKRTNNKYNIKHNINIKLLSEQCTRATTSISNVEKMIDNWDELDRDNDNAFNILMNTIKEYSKVSRSKSDINKAINMIGEKALPRVDNMKKAEKIIEKFIKETCLGYSLLIECNMYKGCDRVLNNQIKLEKIVNIDLLISESNIVDNNSLVDCVYKLCESIDSINTRSFDIKYNLALENIMYSLEKNHVKYEPKLIIETVTDYFLYKNLNGEILSDIRDIISETVYYSDEDKKDLEFIFDDTELDCIDEGSKNNPVKDLFNKFKVDKTKSPSILKTIINKIYTKSANNIIDETPNFLSWIRQFLIFSTVGINPYLGAVNLFFDKFIQLKLQRDETDRFIRKIEAEKKKTESKLSKIKDNKAKDKCEDYLKTLNSNLKKIEEYRESLYTEKELDKMEDEKEFSLESFLEEDKTTVKEYFDIHHHRVSTSVLTARNELSKLCNARYKNLITDSVLSIISIDDVKAFELCNHDTIENYIGVDNKIFVRLGECLPLNFINENNNIGTMRNILFNITEILQSKIGDDFTIFFDGDDELMSIYLSFDIKLHECDITNENTIHQDTARELSLILALEMSVKEYIDDNTDDLLSVIDDELGLYDSDDIDTLTSFSLIKSDIINPNELYNIFSDFKRELYKSDDNSKYMIGSALQENMFKISYNESTVDDTRNRYEIYNDLIITNEALSAIRTINETSVKNNIIIAREKLKKATLKLSDKEKVASRQMDNALAKFNEKIQKDLSNKNREAVIKGTIIPSASSIIKIALASGAVALINPALAVITSLGALAASKIGTRKEKQFILDEIEIQLKLIEKKIQLAESNNDMVALEQLLKMEQKLKRERQRIIYRLKNYYPVSAN